MGRRSRTVRWSRKWQPCRVPSGPFAAPPLPPRVQFDLARVPLALFTPIPLLTSVVVGYCSTGLEESRGGGDPTRASPAVLPRPRRSSGSCAPAGTVGELLCPCPASTRAHRGGGVRPKCCVSVYLCLSSSRKQRAWPTDKSIRRCLFSFADLCFVIVIFPPLPCALPLFSPRAGGDLLSSSKLCGSIPA